MKWQITRKESNSRLLAGEQQRKKEVYGIFSYSQSQVDYVDKHIQNLEQNHKKQPFHYEYITLSKV